LGSSRGRGERIAQTIREKPLKKKLVQNSKEGVHREALQRLKKPRPTQKERQSPFWNIERPRKETGKEARQSRFQSKRLTSLVGRAEKKKEQAGKKPSTKKDLFRVRGGAVVVDYLRERRRVETGERDAEKLGRLRQGRKAHPSESWSNAGGKASKDSKQTMKRGGN